MGAFPGVFSEMKIMSDMYASSQQFMPTMHVDEGLNMSKEYAVVKAC